MILRDFLRKYLCKYLKVIRLPLVNAELRDYMPIPGGSECLVAVPLQEYHCESTATAPYNDTMSAERDQVRFEIPERLQDEPDLVARLQKEHHSFLRAVLINRGATQDEADDLLGDLWGDCVGQSEDRPSLLEKYSGKCPIRSWLKTVATNRLIDLKRRQEHRGELPRLDSDDADASPFERLPATPSADSESALVKLLKDSLQAAFAKCAPEAMLMLRLVYLNAVSQREVCRMWGWPEYKVSRFMSDAMERIEAHTLNELKTRDPWLELSWQDFIELCESHDIGFL